MLADWLPSVFPLRDPVVLFAFVLILMLAAPIAMGRLRLPGMIGLLLSGAILGPKGLGVLARDASFVLLGAVGLIYIMFTASLEIDLAVFKRYRVQGVVFGVLTFALPQGLGTLVGYYLLEFELPAAILLASMFASHTLVAYPIASRLGIGRNRAVTTTIGGTIITDVTALLVLAVIAGMARGEVNDAFWWRLGVSMVVYVSAILVGLPYLGRWFFRRMAKDGPGEFVFVLSSVFLCAALSELAGVEPIVGAFLAGLALNRLIPHQSALMNRLVFTGEAIFIPFFLISVGMILDARVLFGGARSWIVAIAMVVTVTLTKFLAAETARLVFRYNVHEGRVMFGLSVAQAAATLAAVMVGHAIGLFDDAVVNGTIVMILVTCIIGPLMVDRHARHVAAKEKDEDPRKGRESERILVPVTSAKEAQRALELAMLLRPEGGEPIHPMFVVSEGEGVEARVIKGERMLGEVLALASAADVAAKPVARVGAGAGVAITRAQKELRISDVVAAWDARVSSEARTYGGVLDEIAADGSAILAVAYLPHDPKTTTRVRFAVPPGSCEGAGFDASIARVKRLAHALGARLQVLAERAESKVVRARVSDGTPSVTTSLAPLETWSALAQALSTDDRPHDLTVVLCPREGAPGSAQGERSLPRALTRRFPERSFVFLHPSHAPRAELRADAATTRPLVTRDRIVLGLGGLDLEEAIRAMLRHARPDWPHDDPPSDAAVGELAGEARSVASGVSLVHYVDPRAQETALWLGLARGGLAGDAQVQVLVFAVVPSKHHATWLLDLAERVRRACSVALVERAAGAASVDEVVALLAAADEPDADAAAGQDRASASA